MFDVVIKDEIYNGLVVLFLSVSCVSEESFSLLPLLTLSLEAAESGKSQASGASFVLKSVLR